MISGALATLVAQLATYLISCKKMTRLHEQIDFSNGQSSERSRNVLERDGDGRAAVVLCSDDSSRDVDEFE